MVAALVVALVVSAQVSVWTANSGTLAGDRPEIELWMAEDPENIEAVWGSHFTQSQSGAACSSANTMAPSAGRLSAPSSSRTSSPSSTPVSTHCCC